MKYEWTRFWCARDGVTLVDVEGYLCDPAHAHAGAAPSGAVPFAQLQTVPCVVLLGEPGIGKSTAIRDAFDDVAASVASSGNTAKRFDLRSYGDESRLVRDLFESPEVAAWLSGTHLLHLFVDSLDECLLRISTVAGLLTDKLGSLPLNRLRMRIACRTGDWPKLLDDELPRLWGGIGHPKAPQSSTGQHPTGCQARPCESSGSVARAKCWFT